MLSLCNEWEFTPEWSDGFALGYGAGEPVRLPHTVRELPVHYADHQAYQGVCGYRRHLKLEKELAGNGLHILQQGLTAVEPDFPVMMYAVVRAQ